MWNSNNVFLCYCLLSYFKAREAGEMGSCRGECASIRDRANGRCALRVLMVQLSRSEIAGEVRAAHAQ